MPGLIGLIGSKATPHSIRAACRSIFHFSHYVSNQDVPVASVRIAQVWRNAHDIPGAWHSDEEAGVSCYINGTVVRPGPDPRRLDAKALAIEYLADRLVPEQYDGSFVVVVVDTKKRHAIVLNDRLGQLPCYYRSEPGLFSFAPEAKALFAACGDTPAYAMDGLVTFLTLGYCLADTTLFDSIAFLEPATRLLIDLDSGRFDTCRYWKMTYKPDPALRSRGYAQQMLYEGLLAGHRSFLSDETEEYALLLSGGWDSRGMLAAADSLGRKPKQSMTWGLCDDIPGSNPQLARQLARQYGLEHRFIRYDTDSFVKNSMEWSRLTELSTDNYGWYGEGTSVLLNEYMGDYRFVLVGDEFWGTEGHVSNKMQAMAACQMPVSSTGMLAQCLAPEVSARSPEIYAAEVDKVLSACESTNPNERKDFLYAHGRVARFIFALGYYKEFAVEVRRPFLSKNVLDVVERLPTRFRYGKNLYITTLIRYFPDLFKVKKRYASALPHWRRDLRERPGVSEYFADLLSPQKLSQLRISEYLNLQGIAGLAEDFFKAPYSPKSSQADRGARLGARMQSFRQRVTSYEDIRVALHLKDPPTRTLNNFDLLRRIALLALLDQQLSQFGNTSPSSGTDGAGTR